MFLMSDIIYNTEVVIDSLQFYIASNKSYTRFAYSSIMRNYSCDDFIQFIHKTNKCTLFQNYTCKFYNLGMNVEIQASIFLEKCETIYLNDYLT